MIRDLWRREVRFKRSKGVSTVVATIFLVIVVLSIFANVFIWTISQNNLYSQSVRESHQMDADRFSERIIAYDGNYTVPVPGNVQVRGTLANEGPVSAQVLSLWVLDETNKKYNITDLRSRKYNLNPEDNLPITIEVTIPGASSDHTFNSWFVTARGNLAPLQKKQEVIIADVAQGIGSIAMDFRQFRYYEVPNNNDGTDIGSPRYDFTIDSNKYTLLCVALTNLDPSQKAINLTRDSYIWMITAHAETIKGDAWDIRKVQNNKLATFDFQILEYGNLTMVYFGATKPKWVRGVVPVFILLFGKLGTSDYGQNLPFIALRVT